jgi:hypothetical protein
MIIKKLIPALLRTSEPTNIFWREGEGYFYSGNKPQKAESINSSCKGYGILLSDKNNTAYACSYQYEHAKIPLLSNDSVKYLADFLIKNGTLPDFVKVEWKTDWDKETIMCMEGYGDNPNDYPYKPQPKLNKDGEIDILKPISERFYTTHEVIELCKKAIQDHYRLTTSQQPYNEEEAEEMEKTWIDRNIFNY